MIFYMNQVACTKIMDIITNAHRVSGPTEAGALYEDLREALVTFWDAV